MATTLKALCIEVLAHPSTQWPDTQGGIFAVAACRVTGGILVPAMRILRMTKRTALPDRNVGFLIDSFEISFCFPDRLFLRNHLVLHIPAKQAAITENIPKLIKEPLVQEILAKLSGRSCASNTVMEIEVCRICRG